MVSVPEECLMRWTVEDVRRIIDLGGFAHPERFELVEGLIVEKMGQNAPHRVALRLTLEALNRVFAAQASVVGGSSLPLSDTSEPEPDVMVVPLGILRDVTVGDVQLLVEISDTSLRKDQTAKSALYARHGIPEYLIVDVEHRRVEIRRHPNLDTESWRETLILEEGGEFTPLGAQGAIRVSDLFGEP